MLPTASEKEQAEEGKKIKAKFLKAMPALAKLRKACRTMAESGFIIGIDGRRLPIRKAHAALNTLLQSAGALVCKMWIVMFDEALAREGFQWGVDYAMMATVHDEVQLACRTLEIAEVAKRLGAEAATKAGEFFEFRCRLDGDGKIGKNWAECH